MVDAPSVYCQSTRPDLGSTAARPLPDCRTASVTPSGPFTVYGEVQLAIFGRSSFQRLAPVLTSTPAVNDSLSFSTMAMSTPSATVRDDDMPRLLEALG